MDYTDIYILLEEYDISKIELFLEKYLCDYTQRDDYYIYDFHADNSHDFETADFRELMRHIMADFTRNYAFYFDVHNSPKGTDRGYVFLEGNNYVYLGLNAKNEYLEEIFYDLQATFDSDYVLYYNIERPLDPEDFKANCLKLNKPRNEIQDDFNIDEPKKTTELVHQTPIKLNFIDNFINKMKKIFFFILILKANIACAQYFDGMTTTWRGDMRQWTIWSDSIDGNLQIRWANNPFEWEYSIGGINGTIKRKWRDDPTLWELTCDNGELLTARMTYPNDPKEWRITDNETTIDWRTRYTNNPSDWTLPYPKDCGEFSAFTPYLNDFQTWNTVDKNTCLSFNARLFMTFLAMFHSTAWK